MISSLHLQLPGWFTAGGPTMWVLGVLSVVALATLVSKILLFARLRPLRTRQADTLLQSLERHGEPTLPETASASPVDKVILDAWERRGLDPQSWEEDALRRGREALADLRGGLRILEVISALAPLLGLLGTVFGMISAFQALEQAGSQVDPAILSGGIWVALLTTAAGLSVAIPALAAFHWADRTIELCREKLQDRLTRLKVQVRRQNTANPAHSESRGAAPRRVVHAS